MAVSARVETMDGAVGKALCYAGVSVGTHEVHFQYDGGNRWGGLGCMSAVRNVNTIIADTILGIVDRSNDHLIIVVVNERLIVSRVFSNQGITASFQSSKPATMTL